MASSSLSIIPHLLLATTVLANPLQNYGHVPVHDELVHTRRDENFIDTPGSPQNLCGESTMDVFDKDKGPLRNDCSLLHRTVEKNLHGFWIASKMGSNGTVWVELTRLRSCGLKVRRTDGQSGDLPIGDEDVTDLVDSLLNGFSARDKLPATVGGMKCNKDGLSAAVEWMICAV